MERIWLFAAALVVFAVRDGLIAGKRLGSGVYLAVVTLAVGLGAGQLGGALSTAEIDAWLAEPTFFGVALAIHALLALWCLRRTGNAPSSRYVELTPTPLHLAAFVLLARFLLESSNALTGPQAGMLIAAAYLIATAVIAFGARLMRTGAGLNRLAVPSHLSAIVLAPSLPFSAPPDGATENSLSGRGGVDWPAALLVFLLPAVSFAWHRYRSRSATRSKSR